MEVFRHIVYLEWTGQDDRPLGWIEQTWSCRLYESFACLA